MKRMRKNFVSIFLLAVMMVCAQDSDERKLIKLGINGGVATPASNVSANIGLDIMYQYLVNPSIGLGISTGYNHFLGKQKTINNILIKNNDVGLLPIAALVRYYPEKIGFYVGADVGYGVLLGNDKVAGDSLVNRPSGGFYLTPKLGWHTIEWNMALQYVKLFTGSTGKLPEQNYNIGALGLSVSYNIPLEAR